MHLSKHKNHRNQAYLNWLREKNCAVSGSKAQCAHHIRLGTNGGTGIKPSDYFCLPLLNEFHTTGPEALHIIGEETFLRKFDLCPKALFVKYLKEFLQEKHDILYALENKDPEVAIAQMIELIEGKLPKLKRPKKKKSSKKAKSVSPNIKASETEFYEKAKELKKKRDKELREKLKNKKSTANKPEKKSLKPVSAYDKAQYEKAKELKRNRDKELRDKLKKSAKKVSKETKGLVSSEVYEKAKEYKRERDKEIRRKLKEEQKAYRKELKKKLNR